MISVPDGHRSPFGIYKRLEFKEKLVEAVELNRPQDSHPATEKVLDSPAESGTFSDFAEGRGRPKTAQKGLNNPEKPDRVRSAIRKPGNE